MSDRHNESHFVWNEGEEDEKIPDYTAWCKDEPNNAMVVYDQGEHCAQLPNPDDYNKKCSFDDGTIWNDIPCIFEMGVICEF